MNVNERETENCVRVANRHVDRVALWARIYNRTHYPREHKHGHVCSLWPDKRDS